MKSGAYDGSNRDDYFLGVAVGLQSRSIVVPGRRESGEPELRDSGSRPAVHPGMTV